MNRKQQNNANSRSVSTLAEETSAYGIGDNTNKADALNDGVIHVEVDTPHYDWRLPSTEEAANDFFAALNAALDKAANYIDFASYDTNQDHVISTDELDLFFVMAGL